MTTQSDAIAAAFADVLDLDGADEAALSAALASPLASLGLSAEDAEAITRLVNTTKRRMLFGPESTLAAAATVGLATAESALIKITGPTTTISSFGAVPDTSDGGSPVRVLRFENAQTVTALGGSASFAAGEVALVMGTTGTTWALVARQQVDAVKDEVLDALSSGLTLSPPFPDDHWLRVEAIDPDNTSFNFNRSATVNPGNAGRPNEVVNFGHNLDPGGGPETAGKGLFGMGFEGHYEPNPGEAYFEWHIYAAFEDDGIQRRPDSLRMDKNSDLAFGWGRLMRHTLLTYTEPKKSTPYMQAQPAGFTWLGFNNEDTGEPEGGFSLVCDGSGGAGSPVIFSKVGATARALSLTTWNDIILPFGWTLQSPGQLFMAADNGQGVIGLTDTDTDAFLVLRHQRDIKIGRYGGNDLVWVDNQNDRVALGAVSEAPRYKTHIMGAVGLTPPAAIEPTANGDLVVEATSDIVVTFKLKGLDGTVRTHTISMSPAGAGPSLALGGAALGSNTLAVSGNTNLTAGAGITLETSSSVATASAYVRVNRAMSTVIGGASTGVAFGYKMNVGGTAPEAGFVNSQAGMPLLLGVNGGTNDQLALNADGSAVLKGILKLTNQSEPATPTGGGVIYVQDGALKYKGSSGTVTTLGAA